MTPPTYRERLRTEGFVLAGCGAALSAALLRLVPGARRWPWNTAGQIALTAGLLAWRGPATTAKALDAAVPLLPGGEGSGEPTPAPHVAGIVGGFAALVWLPERLGVPRAGADAALRVGLGSLVTGLFNALVLAPQVGRAEAEQGRRYFRLTGSRLGRGTKLGWTEAS